MKPSERIEEIYKRFGEPKSQQEITDFTLASIIDYLDEEYKKAELRHQKLLEDAKSKGLL